MNNSNFVQNFIEEVDAMVRFASGDGRSVPAEVVVHLCMMQTKLKQQNDVPVNNFTEQELAMISDHHAILTVLVAPAKPKSITLMQVEAENPSLFYFLGPIALSRQISLLACFFLLMIIFVSVSPEVNWDAMNKGLFESQGITLILNQLFLLGCAGLGATFGCLYQLNEFIKMGSYDPKFDSTYWIRIIMGLMGGLILSELLPANSLNLQGSSGSSDFDKPIAAFLGGFSVDLIYRILNRFIESINQMLGARNNQSNTEINHLKQQLNVLTISPLQTKTKPLTEPNISSSFELEDSVLDRDVDVENNIDTKSPFYQQPEVSGNLTYEAEGTEGGIYHSRKLHVPADSSGLTIGRGYDMKEKTSTKISEDLIQAGVDQDSAMLLSQASGLFGTIAKQFISANNLAEFEISPAVQQALFRKIYAEMEADVKRICNKEDCVIAYGAVDWDKLDSKIKEVLVDLRYRGDYTPRSREWLQKFVAGNDLILFRQVLADQALWQRVPQDRFNRRKNFLNS